MKRTMSADSVMVLGFIMMTGGLVFALFWLTFGGFLLFFMAVMSIPPNSTEEAAAASSGQEPQIRG